MVFLWHCTYIQKPLKDKSKNSRADTAEGAVMIFIVAGLLLYYGGTRIDKHLNSPEIISEDINNE